MAFGELALALAGRPVALGLALAGALPDAGAQALLGRGLGRGALGLADRLARADQLHAHRDRARRARVHQQRLQEQRAHVDARPLRRPQRAVKRAVGGEVRPVLDARQRAGGVRRDAAVAQEASVELALAPAPAPRVIGVADRGGQTRDASARR